MSAHVIDREQSEIYAARLRLTVAARDRKMVDRRTFDTACKRARSDSEGRYKHGDYVEWLFGGGREKELEEALRRGRKLAFDDDDIDDLRETLATVRWIRRTYLRWL